MPATKYKQLARHNTVCNEIFYKVQDCEAEHPFAKFIGKCTEYNTQLEKCIKANRELMLKRQSDKATARKKKEPEQTISAEKETQN